MNSHDLRTMFEAARWSPSGYNEQPWAFIVVRKDDAKAHTLAIDCIHPQVVPWARQAPVLVITATRTILHKDGTPNKFCQYDLGGSVQNLTVQATALGLFIRQIGLIVPEKVRQNFSIPPEYDPFTFLAVGYPGDPDSLPQDLQQKELAPRERKSPAEFVFTNQWGGAPLR